jgi:hypothetical protein
MRPVTVADVRPRGNLIRISLMANTFADSNIPPIAIALEKGPKFIIFLRKVAFTSSRKFANKNVNVFHFLPKKLHF